jgi:hypothetical protein
MDKQVYIASVRQLGEKYTRIESRKAHWATLLGGSRMLARADVAEQYVRELRALEPPPEDAEALERGFLHPIDDRARRASIRAAAPRHWWQKQGTPEPFDYQGQPDFIDFCVDYGLVDPPDWKLHATFDERVRDVGLTPTPVVAAHGLSDAQLQRMRRGGLPRGFGWLAWLGSNPGNGRSVADAITSHPAPTAAVCVTMQQGMGWACFFVDGDAPDFPVGALLMKGTTSALEGSPDLRDHSWGPSTRWKVRGRVLRRRPAVVQRSFTPHPVATAATAQGLRHHHRVDGAVALSVSWQSVVRSVGSRPRIR